MPESSTAMTRRFSLSEITGRAIGIFRGVVFTVAIISYIVSWENRRVSLSRR